jgi:hypothetical protein
MNRMTHRCQTEANYKGSQIHAPEAVHGYVLDMLESIVADEATACDLGCGSGALSQRRVDRGYHLISVDLDLSDFNVDGAMAVEGDFATVVEDLVAVELDAVLAVEVIEHSESPLAPLRAIRRCSDRAVITFPNIHEIHNLVRFARKGEFDWWNKSAYWDTGHQSIMTDWLFEQHCQRSGWRILKQDFVGRTKSIGVRGWIARCLAALAAGKAVNFDARTSSTVVFTIAAEESAGD